MKDETTLKIIETAIALLVYVGFRLLINRNIDKIVAKNNSTQSRSIVIKKAINLTALAVLITILLSIFGVNQSDLLVFIGSLLTVVGIAFFAQWSILANITSGIIIFFNHPLKLEDTITIMDKDFEIEGVITDIGLFFIYVKTKDNELITIPNGVFLQKMIKKKNQPKAIE